MSYIAHKKQRKRERTWMRRTVSASADGCLRREGTDRDAVTLSSSHAHLKMIKILTNCSRWNRADSRETGKRERVYLSWSRLLWASSSDKSVSNANNAPVPCHASHNIGEFIGTTLPEHSPELVLSVFLCFFPFIFIVTTLWYIYGK